MVDLEFSDSIYCKRQTWWAIIKIFSSIDDLRMWDQNSFLGKNCCLTLKRPEIQTQQIRQKDRITVKLECRTEMKFTQPSVSISLQLARSGENKTQV